MKNKNFRCFLLLSVFCLVCLLGCEQSNVPVSGKVTFEDGTAITSGEIIFALENADEYFAKGKIEKDGTYSLTEYTVGKGSKPGCRKGNFKVFIASTSTSIISDDGTKTETTHIIDQGYTNKDQTPLKATVPGGVYDFKVPPYKK
ncbi:MAG: hypothetical protein LBE18_06160 [Planctomycetaceae bacterium]|nr:hypothetical protein [Planctomycetaceae bacterium]